MIKTRYAMYLLKLKTCLGFFGLSVSLSLASATCYGAHGFAQYGDLKYPAGFSHFAYANPHAVRGGTLNMNNSGRQTSFDKFNPFTLKGTAAPGVAGLIFESLLMGSADEVASAYGLLADDVELASDGLSVQFRINPQARFSNGAPVLATDIKYSFDTLMSQQASPIFRSIYANVRHAEVLSDRVIRFDFKVPNPELPLVIGAMPIFSKAWGQRADGSRIDFDKLAFEIPIGSGPYLIENYQSGHTITFHRHANYWGKALNVRQGMFNFDRIRYQLYADDIARLEAFKAGEFDVLVEYRAKNWAKGFNGPKFRSGALLKQEFPTHNGVGMQGFFLNMRRPQFKDVRVRQALGLALDFEWLNRQLFYNQYRRIDSYFTNSELAANASPERHPDVLEKKLLTELDTQFPGKLPAGVWDAIPAPPSTLPPSSLRDNLRLARRLLAQAGWVYRDGALRDAQDRPFVFEMIEDGGALARVINAYARNLEKLGIQVERRVTDFSLYQKRLDEFDFDMTSVRLPDSQSPGNELLSRYGSRAAKEKGSDNLIGVQSPVIDAVLSKLVRAKTRTELISTARVLDRLLLLEYYVVPHWFSDRHRIAYAAKLAYPRVLPDYYSAEAWVMSYWWNKSPSE